MYTGATYRKQPAGQDQALCAAPWRLRTLIGRDLLRGITCAGMISALLSLGCTTGKNRITLDELAACEQAGRQVETPEVDTTKLSLTEVRPYTVGPGDVLSLDIWGLESDYGRIQLRVRVHDDGSLTLPLVGRIEVADLSLGALEAAVQAAYVPDYVKNLTVFAELVTPGVTSVVVVGATAQPGVVTLRRNQRNVLYALRESGGLGYGTSGRVRVRPINPNREEVTYDLADIHDLRRALLAPPLESGDLVVVEPAEASQVYLSGLVQTPGAIGIPPDSRLSVLRAVAAAGGLVDFLQPEKATLWRKLDDGRQVAVDIDLAGIQAGEVPDLDLRPGDILDIPHTSKTRFREWFAQNIRFGPFGMTAVYDPVADYRARVLRGDNNDDIFSRTLLDTFRTGLSELFIRPVVVPATTP